MHTTDHDFDVSHLTGEQLKIAELIRDRAAGIYASYDDVNDGIDWSAMSSGKWTELSGGGCKAFYSPEQWANRKEDWGHDALLIVCHDGGDLAQLFNWDYGKYKMIYAMEEVLHENGYFPEQCTSWYSAIYRIPNHGLQATEERNDGT